MKKVVDSGLVCDMLSINTFKEEVMNGRKSLIVALLLSVVFAGSVQAEGIDTTRKALIGAVTGGTNVLLRNTTDETQPSRWGKSVLVGGSVAAVFIAGDVGNRQPIQDLGAIVAGVAISEIFNTAFYLTSDGKSLTFGMRF